jgi:hypothetical protein
LHHRFHNKHRNPVLSSKYPCCTVWPYLFNILCCVLFWILCLDRPRRLSTVDFPTKSLKELLISPVRAVRLAHPTIADLIGLSLFVEDKKNYKTFSPASNFTASQSPPSQSAASHSKAFPSPASPFPACHSSASQSPASHSTVSCYSSHWALNILPRPLP